MDIQNEPVLNDNVTLRPWSEISTLSDDDLFELFWESGRRLGKQAWLSSDILVRQIASDAVMKVGDFADNEARAMHLVRKTTNILIPSVRRTLSTGPNGKDGAFIMDFVPGHTLEERWPMLNLWRRIRTIWTLRQYIRQLRRVRIHSRNNEDIFPGPIASQPQECQGPMFTEVGAGPFASYADLTAWFMHKLEVNRLVKKHPMEPLTFDDSLPLVLTHLDIHPGNIILDSDDHVWLVDWEYAGFYPQWFEFAVMLQQWSLPGSPEWGRFGRWTRWMIGLIAGFYAKQARFIQSISWAINTGYMM